MAKKMLIDATHAEETRVVVVDGNKVEEFDFESENKRQLAGNIYLAKVTRVEPSLQAAFVDYGGNRHGFLAFSEIHPDYYQIPVADREALLEEERAYAEAMAKEEDEEDDKRRSRGRRSRGRRRSKSSAAEVASDDAVVTEEVTEDAAAGMEVIELDAPEGADALEGHSPMDLVEEAPVAEPDEAEAAAADDASESDGDDSDANEDGDDAEALDASERDESIESVAEEDVTEEIRIPRKPRAKRYRIQEVIKVRQILLVQVVKEERGNKGAALTTYLSLAGRYCVLMPNTARGGGISRKITNAADRKKLKEIAGEIKVPKGAGLIVRTAGAKRTKSEIKRDYEYLQRLWEQIRTHTLESTAPAKIYEEGNLIKRSIRDLYSRDIDEVLVEGEAGYRTAKDFMKMIMPSHAKNVKRYNEALPLFARFQVESYLSGMFNPVVQLKSGGYIVIGVTEALVAIDVNSGRATKEGSIEETALKTNLEAAEEVARQLRLRDLAGLIVIDFIDMDERRNNAAVEKRMKDKLKTDRARIQVGRISGFGLMEMSRQRLRPGMIEATTQPCAHCHGTGLVRSDDNLALTILRQLEEEGTRKRSREVLLKAPVAIVNFLMNHKREHIAQIEARYGLSICVEADPFLISPDYQIERFKTATRVVQEAALVSVDASLMGEVDEAQAEEEALEAVEGSAEGEEAPKKRRRRRRRRGRGRGAEDAPENAEEAAESGEEAVSEEAAEEPDSDAVKSDEAKEEKPKRRRRKTKAEREAEEAAKAEEALEEAPEEVKEEKPKRRRRKAKAEREAEEAAKAEASEETPEEVKEEKPKRRRRKTKAEREAEEAAKAEAAEVSEEAPEAAKEEKPKRKRASRKKKEAPAEHVVQEEAPAELAAEKAPKEATPEPEAAPEPVAEVAPEPVAEPTPEPEPETPPKPKRKGWWSLGSK
ncbi:MAG: ribonuclease [Rhodobacterales bacterium]|nr:MAG: ribonuclease [Rhodobacterales bacterium]